MDSKQLICSAKFCGDAKVQNCVLGQNEGLGLIFSVRVVFFGKNWRDVVFWVDWIFLKKSSN